jgi:hypothetical protein
LTAFQKRLLGAYAALLFTYVALSLSALHVDSGSDRRQDAASIVGMILIGATAVGGLVYGPGYLSRYASEVARELLEESPELRARRESRARAGLMIRAATLALFLAAGGVYLIFFTPDARFSRLQSEITWIEAHDGEAAAQLVAQGYDQTSARLLLAVRLKGLKSEAEKLWPDTEAAKHSPSLPTGILQ